MLSGGDTGYKLAEVDEVLGCLVVQTVEQNEAELERDPLWYTLSQCSSVCKSRDKPRSNFDEAFLTKGVFCVRGTTHVPLAAAAARRMLRPLSETALTSSAL